jgi:deazaflavin-dependent oxidoreductase (nitroreductase family)
MARDTTPKETGSAATRFLMRAAGSLHRGLYRLSGGRLGKALGPMQVLLLTTTGRKSGQARTWPLAYFRDGDRLLVVASAGGEPRHPAWYLNLRDHPQVTVQLGAATRRMTAATATGEERARLWAQIVAVAPNFAEYQQKTTREIPVVILTGVA